MGHFVLYVRSSYLDCANTIACCSDVQILHSSTITGIFLVQPFSVSSSGRILYSKCNWWPNSTAIEFIPNGHSNGSYYIHVICSRYQFGKRLTNEAVTTIRMQQNCRFVDQMDATPIEQMNRHRYKLANSCCDQCLDLDRYEHR